MILISVFYQNASTFRILGPSLHGLISSSYNLYILAVSQLDLKLPTTKYFQSVQIISIRAYKGGPIPISQFAEEVILNLHIGKTMKNTGLH